MALEGRRIRILRSKGPLTAGDKGTIHHFIGDVLYVVWDGHGLYPIHIWNDSFEVLVMKQ